MGKWLHRLREVDTEKRTAICAACGPVSIRHGGYAKTSGQVVWRCIKTANRQPGRGGKASRQRYMSKRRTSKERRRLAFKQSTCERCGFEAAHPSQIDVHHVDGNRANDYPESWQSLCANCHRLATYAPPPLLEGGLARGGWGEQASPDPDYIPDRRIFTGVISYNPATPCAVWVLTPASERRFKLPSVPLEESNDTDGGYEAAKDSAIFAFVSSSYK